MRAAARRTVVFASYRPRNEALPLAGLTIAVTGTLEGLSREEAKEQLEAMGAKFSGSISAKTSALIAGEGGGSKRDKAIEKGVPVLDEAGLLALLAGTPLAELTGTGGTDGGDGSG